MDNENNFSKNDANNVIDGTKRGAKNRNLGLRALLAIKKISATLETDFAELLALEKDLHTLNQKGLSIIEALATPEAQEQWKLTLDEIYISLTGINDKLADAKEKIDQKATEGYREIWKQVAELVLGFEKNSKQLTNLGLDILDEGAHPQWQFEYVELENELVEKLVDRIESCRILLQMIERYTPDELNSITQIIVDQIPLNFTYQEAVDYQTDYYKALINFKKEFKQEKNLWDKFLDILAGGTHQLPSERVMMERWLDGDKEELT